ncbi:MAG TPA: DUF4389 domain-containing protein [Gallionellaceae bacterium]|nr:DUF4389 domain-containing protein [Gallionellaceae bacterium]
MTEMIDPAGKRNIWVRGLFMLLMGLAWHVSATLLFFVALFQFLLVLLNDAPNDRLVAFGRNLARYLRQVASFLTFATEEVPFPFSDWPSGEQ